MNIKVFIPVIGGTKAGCWLRDLASCLFELDLEQSVPNRLVKPLIHGQHITELFYKSHENTPNNTATRSKDRTTGTCLNVLFRVS